MSIILRVNGSPFDNFLSGSVDIRLDSLCNTFSFSLARTETEILPFKVGDSCEVVVNNILVLTGVIEILTVNYNPKDHKIEISGRDTTSDLLDSTTTNLSDISQGVNLKSVIEQVLKLIKSPISVIDNSNVENFNAANDIASSEPGDSAFRFVEILARQRQVLLTSNGDGNIVITQGSGQVLTGARIQNTLANNQDNNVISATATFDLTQRYNRYILSSQGNLSVLRDSAVVEIDSIIDREGNSTDDEVKRVGRLLTISAESAETDTDNFNRCKWERNIRRARGNVYSVEVFQHSIDGDPNNSNIWEINKLVKVVDDFAGINGNLLINSITFSLSVESGSKTIITFVEPDAYTLELEESSMGEGLT